MDVKDLAGFGEPVKILIERCADAIGAIAHPFQITRIATSEGDAEIIKAQKAIEVEKVKVLGAIEVSEVQKRALERVAFEEAKRQKNIESILNDAIPQVNPSAQPRNIDQDWLDNFFDKCRLTSDREMQAAWAKVLAGEANSPGRFSKRLVNLLQSLGKSDAEQLQLLACFSVTFDKVTIPLIFDVQDEIYMNAGLNQITVLNLTSLGLIDTTSDLRWRESGQLQAHSNFMFEWERAIIPVSYFSSEFLLHLTGSQFYPRSAVSGITMTPLGMELLSICDKRPIDGFPEYLVHKWTSLGYKIQRTK